MGEMELIFVEGKAYSIIFTIPDSSYNQHSGDVAAVLDSIELDEAKAPVFGSESEGKAAEEDDAATETEPELEPDSEAEPEPEPSKYGYACVRRMSGYDIYYLFDLDEMTAIYFVTNDSALMELPCSGDLSGGLTADYVDDGFKEHLQFKTPGDDSVLTLIDANGIDWEYTKVDVAEAEAVLASISS